MTGDREARTDGYRRLVARFGEDRVAAALLAKWLTDGTAEQKWGRLMDRIESFRPGTQPLVYNGERNKGRS